MKPKSESWRQAALARADFEMVALDYFRRLGHDNHHRLFQVYGWEEKKTKTSWGANTVNHEKLAEARGSHPRNDRSRP